MDGKNQENMWRAVDELLALVALESDEAGGGRRLDPSCVWYGPKRLLPKGNGSRRERDDL